MSPSVRGAGCAREDRQHRCPNPGLSEGDGQMSTWTFAYDLQRGNELGGETEWAQETQPGWGIVGGSDLSEPGDLKAGHFKSLQTELSSAPRFGFSFTSNYKL